MRKDDKFTSERLLFRGISEIDTDCLVKWRSDKEVIQYFRQPTPITREKHIQWYEQSYCQNANRYDFIVLEKCTGQAIGTVGVNNLNWETSSCEISYMIAESSHRRRGYAVESIAAMMRIMLTQNIYHFFAEIHSNNLASIRTISKLGFSILEEHPPFAIYHKREEMDIQIALFSSTV